MKTRRMKTTDRRKFIKLSLLGITGALAAPVIIANTPAKQKFNSYPPDFLNKFRPVNAASVNHPGQAPVISGTKPGNTGSHTGMSGQQPGSRSGNILSRLTGKQKKAGLALIGLGNYSSRILAPALQETKNVYLAGIVTGTMDNEKKWMDEYNIPRKNVYNYDNFDEIASNRDIDIIYVVLPNSMHKEFTIRAARAGKHVFCEKPMALNAEECREMIRACRDNGVVLSIGYRMQFEPYTQEIMRLGQEKVFGNVLHITCGAAFRDTSFDHWRWEKEMGGGAMMDMGVYPLQAARYVTGEEPVRVTAQTFVTRPGKFEGVDEATTFQLEFPGGTVASLDTGFHANFNHLYAFAENGWFELRPFSAYSGIDGRTSEGELNFPAINQQALQMDEEAANMMAGRPVRVPGEEGLRDMIVVDAVFESINTGRPVDVDLTGI